MIFIFREIGYRIRLAEYERQQYANRKYNQGIGQGITKMV